MEFYMMVALHCVDETDKNKINSNFIMYPFDTKVEMMEFKDKIDALYREDPDILDFAERDR